MFTLTITDAEILDETTKVYDADCRNWQDSPTYNSMFLFAQENYANDVLRARGHLVLNDVYLMLGLPQTRLGLLLGWTHPDSVKFYPARQEDGSYTLTFNPSGVIYNRI